MEVVNRKKQFPIICFSGKTPAKILVEMLFNPIVKVFTATYVKSVKLFRKKDVDRAIKEIELALQTAVDKLALHCTPDGS